MNNHPTILPPSDEPTFIFGGFWRRFGAIVIDLIVIVIAALVLGAVAGALGANSMVAQLIGFGISVGYNIYMNGAFGATLGKMALDMRIVQIDGRRIDYTTAALRYSPFIVFGVISILLANPDVAAPGLDTGSILNLLYCIAAIIVLVSNPMKRTLHDLLAKTVVIRKGAEFPEPV